MMPKYAVHKEEVVRAAYLALRKPLRNLFNAMDEAYNRVAVQSGFVCRGCPENCCRSRFYHHTYLEYYYLLEGFKRLEPAKRSAALASAAPMSPDDALTSIPLRTLCPLHFEGICSIYPYRPLICRLHGVPHKLEQPGGRLLRGPGCAEFERAHRNPHDIRLDRTPLYRQMAELEGRFKQASGLTLKMRMTVAEMILSYNHETYPYRQSE